jgi:hypothetical protein
MWALIGAANTGKSTFVAAMKDPVVVIDPDGRFNDVAEMMSASGQDAYSLSNVAADHHDALTIQKALEKNMPGARIGTIALDSMTSLLEPLITRIMLEIEQGKHKNRAVAWRPKAETVRLITHSMAKWGTDVVYIYHEQDNVDAQGQSGTRRTVTELEESRMMMNLTARIRLDQDKDGRFAEVIWSRTGRTGKVYDEEGMWTGVPELIDDLIWGGLTEQEQDIADGKAPDLFTDATHAIAWGFAQGCFRDMQHSKNAYNKVKEEVQPKNAMEMRNAWTNDVDRRVREAELSDEERFALEPEAEEEPEVKAYNAPDGVVYACPDCDEPVPDDGENGMLECANCEVVFNPKTCPAEEYTEVEAPEVFQSPEAAIQWAMGLEAFVSQEVAESTYKTIRGLDKVTNAQEMRDAWVAQVTELKALNVQAIGVADNGPIVQELELEQEVVEPGKWPTDVPTVPEAPPPIDEAPPEVPF